MKIKKKQLQLVLLSILSFFLINHNLPVFAQQSVKSNKVITRVGEAPLDQKPGGGSSPVQQPGETKPGSLGLAISCPVGSTFQVTCGTAANPVPGSCGHGGIGYATTCNPYYYACNGSRYSDALYKSLDVIAPGKNTAPVYLPFVNGEPVTWNVVQNLIPIGASGEWGYKLVYQGEYKNQIIRLDLTHLNGDASKILTLPSGTQIGTYNAGVNHLHTAVAVGAKWVEPRLEVGMCAN